MASRKLPLLISLLGKLAVVACPGSWRVGNRHRAAIEGDELQPPSHCGPAAGYCEADVKVHGWRSSDNVMDRAVFFALLRVRRRLQA
ncbi:unnamed protein product [Urochloa humidicola]